MTFVVDEAQHFEKTANFGKTNFGETAILDEINFGETANFVIFAVKLTL